MLRSAGADVTVRREAQSHGLEGDDLHAAGDWLRQVTTKEQR
jgi:hypothetical protein